MGVRRLFHTTIATEAQDNSLLSTEQTLTLLRKPTEAAPPTERRRPWPSASSLAFYDRLFPLALHKIP